MQHFKGLAHAVQWANNLQLLVSGDAPSLFDVVP